MFCVPVLKESIRQQIVKGTLGVGGLTALSLLLSLSCSIVLARGLGPDDFGRYAFVMACVALLSLPVGTGVLQLVTREVAVYHDNEKWGLFRGFLRWICFRGVWIASVLMALVLCLSIFHTDWSRGDRWLLLAIGSLMIPLLCLLNIKVGALRGLGYPVYAKIPDLLVRPASHLSICGAVFLLGRLDPGIALASQVFAVVFALVYGGVLLRKVCPVMVENAVEERRSHEWASAWRTFVLLVGASMLNSQLGIVLLGWLGSNRDVASLRLASKGAQFVTFSLVVINMVIAPHVAQAYSKGNHGRLQRLSRQSARVVFAGALPVALSLIFLGGPIIGVLFGKNYVSDVKMPLAILAGGQLLNAFFGSVGLFLMMSGHEDDTFHGQAWALVVNLSLALFLIPRFGATGAACAAAAGLIIWNLVLAVKLFRRLGIRPAVF